MISDCPVISRESVVSRAWAESAAISGVRETRIISSPPRAYFTAAVATVVAGHSVLAAMPSSANSAARPRVTIVIPYFARV